LRQVYSRFTDAARLFRFPRELLSALRTARGTNTRVTVWEVISAGTVTQIVGTLLACGLLVAPCQQTAFAATAAQAGTVIGTYEVPERLEVEGEVVPPGVSAYEGWAAWSRYELATRQYRLVVRNPSGVISSPNVAAQKTAFDLKLGPDATGSVAAVYPRCRDATKLIGCQIFELAIEAPTATEIALSIPGGGSVYRPALWKGVLAFARVVPRGGAYHPVDVFEWKIGSNTLRRLPLPDDASAVSAPGEALCERPREDRFGAITSLSLNGNQVAYTRYEYCSGQGTLARVGLWSQRLGDRPQKIALVGTGGAGNGLRTFLSPTIVGGWLYSYRQYAEIPRSSGESPNTWTRYNLSSRRLQQATIDLGNDEESQLLSVIPVGAGVLWSRVNEEAGLKPLSEIAEVRTAPAVRWVNVPKRKRARTGRR
jgi:hypothetical protein